MKKITFILAAILVCIKLTAQPPVIEGRFLPVLNTSFNQAWDTTTADFIIGPAGENQFWDYSTNFDNICAVTNTPTLDADLSPYGSLFPLASHATHSASVFGDSIYYYFSVDTIGFHIIGTRSFVPGFNTSFSYSPTELFSFDEIHYLDVMDVQSRALGNFTYGSWAAKHYLNTTVHYEADAYGTLALPLATYSDVMRIKEDRVTIDSIFVDYTGMGTYTYLTKQTIVNERYHFMRNNTFGTTIVLHIGMPVSGFTGYAWYVIPSHSTEITGTVFNAEHIPVTSGEAYLYRKCSNFTRDDILDFSPIDPYGHYSFDSIHIGTYLIGVRPNPLTEENSLFTYYGDTTSWLLAEELVLEHDTSGIDINLCYHDTLDGLGSISGFVTENFGYTDGSKGTLDFGEPVPGAEIYLEQEPEGEPIASNPTDESGHFNINEIPDGEYTLFVDISGLNMSSSYNFTVLGGTVYGNLDFVMGSDSIFATNEITGLSHIESSNELSVYPNPFDDSFTVNAAGMKYVEIYFPDGRLAIRKNADSDVTDLNMNNYPSGIYIIKCYCRDDIFISKIIRE